MTRYGRAYKASQSRSIPRAPLKPGRWTVELFDEDATASRGKKQTGITAKIFAFDIAQKWSEEASPTAVVHVLCDQGIRRTYQNGKVLADNQKRPESDDTPVDW